MHILLHFRLKWNARISKDLYPHGFIIFLSTVAVADPGFPIGGINLVGGVHSWSGYVSKILYVETKESGPLGKEQPQNPQRTCTAAK